MNIIAMVEEKKPIGTSYHGESLHQHISLISGDSGPKWGVKRKEITQSQGTTAWTKILEF